MVATDRPLVGRERELSQLTALLGSLDARGGAVALVTGDPGIGKSRLLGEVARGAEERGAVVLTGRASEFEHGFPFGVVVDALDDYLRSLREDLVPHLDEEDVAECAAVFPALRGARPAGSEVGRAPDDRVRAYFAIRSLIERIARGHPLVLALDDLHWADRASVELVAHLVRRPPSGPVLILGAYRPQQVDGDLAAAVARAEHDASATLVGLRPLAAPDVGVLLGVGPAEQARLHHLSGGNPFLLLELAKSGAPRSVTDATALPPAVAGAIVHELDALPAAARALAEAGAVIGDPFDLDLAVAASRLSEDDALAALDELARQALITRTEVPRRFAFRHPLVRHAVYASLLPGRRLTTHERCAELLARRGASPAERAHHVEFAARQGDAAAVALLADAATAVAPRAPASALRWRRAALRLHSPDGSPAERLRLLLPLPDLLLALGELREARDHLVEALALAPTDDPALRTRLSTSCAAVEQLLGQHEEAHHRLAAALAELGPGCDREAASLMIALVMDGFYRRQRDQVRDSGRQAVEWATRIDDRPLLAAAHAALALALALSDEPEVAAQHRDAAAALVDAMADAEIGERLDAIGLLAGAELYLDRFRASAEHAERGLRIGRATGTTSRAPTLIPTLGTALWVLGRIAESVAVLDEAVEAARAARDEQALAWQLFNLGYAQLMAGDLDGSLRSTGESHAIATRLGDSVLLTWACLIEAFAHCESGDAATAVAQLVEAGGGPELSAVPGAWKGHGFEYATRCWVLLDDLAEAELAAARARDLADTVGLPYARSMAARATATCALARGDVDEAVTHARTAVSAAEEAAARTDASLARILLGRALAAAGSLDEAVEELQAAVTDLDDMGAVRYRGQAERELGRLGRRPHRRTRSGNPGTGVAALTERELEIVELLLDRRTNTEIADRLFLSAKTVETHLRNIFRKLGVSSRADAARVLEVHRRSSGAAAYLPPSGAPAGGRPPLG